MTDSEEPRPCPWTDNGEECDLPCDGRRFVCPSCGVDQPLCMRGDGDHPDLDDELCTYCWLRKYLAPAL